MLWLSLSPGVASTPLFNMIPIRTLSLFSYFTYVSIDMSIYALGDMSWSSRVFRSMGRVIAEPSLGCPSPYGVIPWVPTLVSSPKCLTNEYRMGLLDLPYS
jgi:hypothetical protein